MPALVWNTGPIHAAHHPVSLVGLGHWLVHLIEANGMLQRNTLIWKTFIPVRYLWVSENLTVCRSMQ